MWYGSSWKIVRDQAKGHLEPLAQAATVCGAPDGDARMETHQQATSISVVLELPSVNEKRA